MSQYGWSSDPKTDRELYEKYGPSVHEPCARRDRGYRILLRRIAERVKAWIPPEALLDCIRAGGNGVCPTCGLEIREHLEVAPTFHIGCHGEIWKT